MKFKLSKLLILIMIIVSLQGCSYTIPERTIDNNNSITYAVESFPESIDIKSDFSIRDKEIFYSIFDGLVDKNEKGDIVPELAESYSVSKDGLEYVFKLRDDIYWSDGSKITADDFLKFFKAIISPKNKEAYVSELYNVYGVKDYHEGRGTFENNVAISKSDKASIKFRMNVKDNDFVKKMSEGCFKLRDISSKLDNYKTEFSSIKYSGQYSIKNIKDNKEIELQKNDKYWSKKGREPKEIVLKIYSGAELALADFESKKNVDIILDVPNSEISRLTSKNLVEIFPADNMKTIEFNPDSKDDKTNLNMRRALEKTILSSITGNSLVKEDKFQLALGELERKALKSNESIVSSNVTDASKNFDVIKDQVNSLLEKSNYKGGTLRLVCLNNDENKNICDFISKNLKDLYGITVKYNLLEQDQLDKTVKGGEYELLLEDIGSSSDVYGELVAKWVSNNKNKSISNNDITNILSSIDKKDDVDNRNKGLVKLLRDNTYIVPLLFDNLICVKSDKIKSLTFDKDGALELKKIELSSSTEGLKDKDAD